MARLPTTRTYTFTATGKALLTSILDQPTSHWLGSLAMRADRNNVGDVFWSDGMPPNQYGGFIGPAEAVTFDFGWEHAQCRTFTIFGVQGDKVYLTVGENVL